MTVAKKLAELISEGSQSKTSPYDTTGVVKRIEGKTAYVVFDGGYIETPVDLTIACEKGDIVVVRVSGTKARLTGNLSAPPTDDKAANEAKRTASLAYRAALSVTERADAGEFDGEDGQDGEDGEDGSSVYEVRTEYCLSTSNSQFIPYQGMEWSEDLPEYVSGCYIWTRTVIYYDDDDETVVYGDPVFSLSEQLNAETRIALDSTNNHFWHDSTGAYVTEEEGTYAAGYATRITGAGILQSYNGKLMSSWTNSGVSFYKSDGETALASFGIGGISFANDVPFVVGNNTSFIKWVQESGVWKIKICADSIEMGGQEVMTDGDAGKWYSGTGITGTPASPTIFPNSGISDAKVGDMYLNTSTSNTYRCTTGGAPPAARWVFASNIKGADGEDGEDGQDGRDGIDVTSQYMSFDSTDGLKVYSGNKTDQTYSQNYINIKSGEISFYMNGGRKIVFAPWNTGGSMQSLYSESRYALMGIESKYAESFVDVRAVYSDKKYATIEMSANSSNNAADSSYITLNARYNGDSNSGYINLMGNVTVEKTIESWYGGTSVSLAPSSSAFYPSTNNYTSLGTAAHKWSEDYVVTRNTGSDGKDKDIVGDLIYAKEFIMSLNPIEYMWKDGDHKRTHMGFIAQEVADFSKGKPVDLSIARAHYPTQGEEAGPKYSGEEIDDELLRWTLCYEEFIAPLVKVVQMQQEDIDKLKQATA